MRATVFVSRCLAVVVLASPAMAGEQTLLGFTADSPLKQIEARDTKLSLSGSWLELATGQRQEWPGITLKAPVGRWDVSQAGEVLLDLKNTGNNPVEVSCRVDNPGADGSKNCITARLTVQPGEVKTLHLPLRRALPETLRGKLFGMRGYPGGFQEKGGIDPANVEKVLVFVAKPKQPHRFQIANLRAGGTPFDRFPTDPENLFPLIDAFGQYRHGDWPGKIGSAADFRERAEAEKADLAEHPGPQDWDKYGGWQAGPQLDATGRFRVEKRDGKWWLVDPDGRLFWSHGIDCVRADNSTPITDRKHYFAELPAKEPPWAALYGRSGWAPHGYYQNKPYETFNFLGANLLRKYGPEWKPRFIEMAHRRLRSWGMNTVANWSDPAVYAVQKTPYVTTVHFNARALEGSEGYWGKFPDPFDAKFNDTIRRGVKQGGDPWCLGYFVGNELSWGDELSLARAALASPAGQPAKQALLADLKAKYGTIERLNAAWGTTHASWDALAESRTPPDAKRAREDLGAFYTRLAERFFEGCRDAVRQADPKGLYLGCRFAWANDRAIRASAKYCDVVSFNKYQRSIADLRLPEGLDRPLVIGEFHFGALDRGMFHTGLVPTANQEERAAAYQQYVEGALRNPLLVGTHWFQYDDQATTGRGDGENYQIGFVDTCDTPYPETIRACREVGYRMYPLRAK